MYYLLQKWTKSKANQEKQNTFCGDTLNSVMNKIREFIASIAKVINWLRINLERNAVKIWDDSIYLFFTHTYVEHLIDIKHLNSTGHCMWGMMGREKIKSDWNRNNFKTDMLFAEEKCQWRKEERVWVEYLLSTFMSSWLHLDGLDTKQSWIS